MLQGLAGLEALDVGDHGAHRRLGHGHAGDMRRHEDARMLPEGMLLRQRLLAEHVERGAADLAAVEGLQQVFLDEVAAAPDIDDRRADRQTTPQLNRPSTKRMPSVCGVSGKRQIRMSVPARNSSRPPLP